MALTYIFVRLLKDMFASDFVDDLCNTYHLSIIIQDRHAENTVGSVPRLLVHIFVEPRILREKG